MLSRDSSGVWLRDVLRALMRQRTPREREQRERLARWVGASTSRPHDVAQAAGSRAMDRATVARRAKA